MSSYHIWAWMDRTTEDFVCVVAGVPDSGGEAEVVSLSEISPDERSAGTRLQALVVKVEALILARGDKVLDVTMGKMPAQLGAPSHSKGGQLDVRILTDVADATHRHAPYSLDVSPHSGRARWITRPSIGHAPRGQAGRGARTPIGRRGPARSDWRKV